jgi:poly(hydroxyalkanoate) granule-associated protein
MVKKLNKSQTQSSADSHMAAGVKESASQIWLAGLGAFAKAQEEGGKVFDTLVRQGLSIQRKTQSMAEEKISEATNRMSGMAGDIASKATGQWDKLENIFEDRVAKALNKLGVPSAKDIDALIARIDALSASVAKMGGSTAKAAKAPAKKTVSKSAAKPATKSAAKPAAKRG